MEVICETLLIGFLKTTRTKNERENERPRVSLSSIHIPPLRCELAERIASPHLCRRLQLRRRRLPLAVIILLGQVVMRHVQVQRASARDEPINLRRESTLSIVSRSFVRSSRAHRGRARVDVSVMIPPRRDRSIERLSRASHDRSTRSRSTTRRYIFFIVHSLVPRAHTPLARVARARSNAPARDSASRRDDDRTRPPPLVAPDSAWRASFERVKQNTAIFSRSSFALPRRVARRRVAVDRSIGRIESNREEVSIHPVLSDS